MTKRHQQTNMVPKTLKLEHLTIHKYIILKQFSIVLCVMYMKQNKTVYFVQKKKKKIHLKNILRCLPA